ncbi:MAG TPA: hypothetical protein VGR43_04085 [Dehalococcoidia bacterium]|jgi:hypothetical protein|nr:hypothetical protein [Dehalococcoidia bacterium]
MEKALARREPAPLALRGDTSMDQTLKTAELLARSGYFSDAKDAAQAFAKILAGQELGLGAFQALSSIHIVQGKPVLSATLIAALVKRSGRYNYRVRRMDETVCEIEFSECGESVGVSSFTMAEAKRAGLATKDIWQKYPSDMLFARAMSRGAKHYCADVFGGAIYTPDEITPEDYAFTPGRTPHAAHRALESRPPEPAPALAPPAVDTAAGEVVDAAPITPPLDGARQALIEDVVQLFLEADELDLFEQVNATHLVSLRNRISSATDDELLRAREELRDTLAKLALDDEEPIEGEVVEEQSAPAAQQQAQINGCEVCSKPLTPGRVTLSKQKLGGRVLCIACEKAQS